MLSKWKKKKKILYLIYKILRYPRLINHSETDIQQFVRNKLLGIYWKLTLMEIDAEGYLSEEGGVWRLSENLLWLSSYFFMTITSRFLLSLPKENFILRNCIYEWIVIFNNLVSTFSAKFHRLFLFTIIILIKACRNRRFSRLPLTIAVGRFRFCCLMAYKPSWVIEGEK